MSQVINQSSHALSIISGDSHMKIANNFLQSIPIDMNEVAKNAMENSGNFSACATNLALAIELYLKAFLITHQIEPEKIHDLKKLYDALPKNAQKLILSTYKSYKPNPQNPFGKLSSIELLASEKESRIKDKGMESVLARSKDNFVEFRYIFDTLDRSNTNSILFEYGSLWCIARSIRMQLGNPTLNYSDRKVVLRSPFL